MQSLHVKIHCRLQNKSCQQTTSFVTRKMAVYFGRTVFCVFNPLKSSNHAVGALTTLNSHRNKSKFKAAILTEPSKPLKIEEQKDKKLNKNEVRVKVECCSVNVSDVMICRGAYDVTPTYPFVPGYELSGKIIEVGTDAAKEGFNVDDRIVGLNKESFSGFAEHCVLPTKDVWQLPSSISCSTAVALADSYCTALIGLVRRARLHEGNPVLITVGAGGLGLAAVDIAANVYRAKVIAVCATEDKAALIREKGAWSAVSYVPKDVVKICADVTKNQGVKIMFEAVGHSEGFPKLLKCISHEGVVVIAGTASRSFTEVKTADLLPTSFSVTAVSLRNYRKANPQVYRQSVQDAIDMCDQGLVTPHISKEFPLEEVNEAISHIQDKKTAGKVILTLSKE